jgi:DNA-binding MarR family transcriptional regulator
MYEIEEAVAALIELMTSGHGNVMEQLNRSAKGELFVLAHLSGKDMAVLPSELSHALHSSTARISAVLGSLEKKGQIRREIDTSNRRNILVTITDRGRERIGASVRHMRAVMTKILAEMGAADAMEFVRLHRRFLEIAGRVMGVEHPADGAPACCAPCPPCGEAFRPSPAAPHGQPRSHRTTK